MHLLTVNPFESLNDENEV